MRAVLLVMAECEGCDRAEVVWRAACEARGLEFAVASVDREPGAAIGRRLRVTTFPAFVIDDEVVAVGVPSAENAATLLERRHPRG